MTLGLTKIGICTMLSRIFDVPSIRLIVRILIGFTCCWMIAAVLIGFLNCHPLQIGWDPLIPGGKCGDQILLFAASGLAGVMTDFFIFLVPIPVILKLDLPRASKFGLLLIFGLGIVYVSNISTTP